MQVGETYKLVAQYISEGHDSEPTFLQRFINDAFDQLIPKIQVSHLSVNAPYSLSMVRSIADNMILVLRNNGYFVHFDSTDSYQIFEEQ